MAGLLAARVLSSYFTRVTIVERDALHDYPETRKGQPQASHLHGLLAAGLQTMLAYLPDLRQALIAGGAVVGDMGETMNWYTHGGFRKPLHLGMEGVLASRPYLELLVRERVQALPNVTVRDMSAVRQLLLTPDRARVTGVLVQQRGDGQEPEALPADLVIDCSGRGSRLPQWLRELGYPQAPETVVQVNVEYVSRFYRRDLADPRAEQWTLITPEPPADQRFGGLFPVEGPRWLVSLGGRNGDYPRKDEAAYLAFARSLPVPDIHQIISRAEPLSDIVAHRFPSSLRRHYEKMTRFPAGLLALGDAVCCFNPTYGQGMTAAALQARELDRLLQERPRLEGLAPAFFQRAAKVTDIPWQLAVGQDFLFPGTIGDKPRGTDFINRYVARVHRATHHDTVVGAAFLRVMNLLAPPPSLFDPRIFWRVLRSGRPRITSRGEIAA
jgi:2-polyprenyl-6-methoxyphenol hydroxylase-like FAD-dependent oxidoreductase